MKIIVLKNHLKNGLDAISKIGSESGPLALPVLKNCLIETVDNKIKLSMTNLEVAITTFVPIKVIEPGELTVSFSLFNSIINNIQSERIDLESQNDNLIIKTDNYQAKIQGIKKEEFPIIPKIENSQSFFEIPNSLLKKSLSLIENAAQVSGSRTELNSVLFDYQVSFLKIAATDSFRLAEKSLTNNQFKSNHEQSFKAVIPVRTIQEVIRIFKEENPINIYFDNNQVLFKTENTEIISRLVNAEFPDYQSIIPKSPENEIIISKEQLINALKLVSVFSDKLNEIKLLIKEKEKNLEVYSTNKSLGENHYLIPAKIKSKSLEIVFNWRFLLDGIKNLESEEIFIGLDDDNKPALIKSAKDISYFYILMPIKSN